MLKNWCTELSEKWCRLLIDLVFIPLNLNLWLYRGFFMTLLSFSTNKTNKYRVKTSLHEASCEIENIRGPGVILDLTAYVGKE